MNKTYTLFPMHRNRVLVSITFRCWWTLCRFLEWRNLKIQMDSATFFCKILPIWPCHFSPVHYTSVRGPKTTSSLNKYNYNTKITKFLKWVFLLSQLLSQSNESHNYNQDCQSVLTSSEHCIYQHQSNLLQVAEHVNESNVHKYCEHFIYRSNG